MGDDRLFCTLSRAERKTALKNITNRVYEKTKKEENDQNIQTVLFVEAFINL